MCGGCIFFLLISLSLALIPRLVVLSVVLFGLPYGSDQSCSITLVDHGRGYLGILVSCLICESAIMWLSMRGSILYTQPREAVQYVIYIRLGKARRRPHRLSNRVVSRCLLKVGEAVFNWFLRSEHCLYWSDVLIIFLLAPFSPYSPSSYSFGGVSVCRRGNCLACPVLPAMLWCHCQKPGFGWVRKEMGPLKLRGGLLR